MAREILVKELHCRVLSRRCIQAGQTQRYMLSAIEYLVCNGMMAGRWTMYFGPHCCADSNDCKLIQDAQYHTDTVVTANGNVWGQCEFHKYIIRKV